MAADPSHRRGPGTASGSRPRAPETPLVPFEKTAGAPRQRNRRAEKNAAKKRAPAQENARRRPSGNKAAVPSQANAGRRTSANRQPPASGAAPKRPPSGPKRPPRNISYGEALRRRARRRFLAGAALVALLAAGAFLSLRVLLKVDSITVTGESPYTSEQIINALPFEQGASMLSVSASKTADKLTQTLPYLEQVEVVKRLPDSVELKITAAQETYFVNSLSGWTVLSANFKVLRITMEQPDGLIAVSGAEADNPVPGKRMTFSEEDKQEAFERVVDALQQTGFPSVSQIDVTSVYDIAVQCGSVRVVLGTVNELPEKLDWARYLLVDMQVQGEQSGTLDVSTRNSEGRLTGHWLPG